MKGTYILLLELSRSCRLNIGALGYVDFSCGWYAYVGSAMNGIEQRVGRHMRLNKRFHWHIDYLMNRAKLKAVFYHESAESKEEYFASHLGRMGFSVIPGFGASDSKCESHLFYSENKNDFISVVLALGMQYMPIAYV